MPSSQQRLALDAVDRVNKDHIAKIDRISPPYNGVAVLAPFASAAAAVLASFATEAAKFKVLGPIAGLAAVSAKVYVDDHKAVDTYKEIVDSWVGDLRDIHGVTVNPDPGNHDNWIITVAPMEPGDTGITKHVTGVGPHWPDSADARDVGHPDAGHSASSPDGVMTLPVQMIVGHPDAGHSASSPDGVMTLPVQTIVGHPDAGHSASSPDGVMTLPVQTIVGHPDRGRHSDRDPAPQGSQQVDTQAGHSPADAKPDHNAPAHGHGVVSHHNQDRHAGGAWHSQAGGTHHAYTPDHQPDARPSPRVSNHAYGPEHAAGAGGHNAGHQHGLDLTAGQRVFVDELSSQTGLDRGVVAAWVHAEENGRYALSRENSGNHNWLNIGYTGSGPRPFTQDMTIWGDPVKAADATAAWMKGDRTGPVDLAGYHAAGSIRAILDTTGSDPESQIHAIGHSGWAESNKYESAIQSGFHLIDGSGQFSDRADGTSAGNAAGSVAIPDVEIVGHPDSGPDDSARPAPPDAGHADRIVLTGQDDAAKQADHDVSRGRDRVAPGDHADGQEQRQDRAERGSADHAGQDSHAGHAAHGQDGHAGAGLQPAPGATHHAYAPDHQPDAQPAPGATHHASSPVQHMAHQATQAAHHHYDPGQQNANPAHQADEHSANAAAAASHHQYDPAHSAATDPASQATEAAAHNSQLASDGAHTAAAAHAAAVAAAAQYVAEMASQAHIDHA